MLLFGIFCDILTLNVKMYLRLKLYTVPFFVSGQTNKISKGSNNYCSHCIYMATITHSVQCARERLSNGKSSLNLYTQEYYVIFGTD